MRRLSTLANWCQVDRSEVEATLTSSHASRQCSSCVKACAKLNKLLLLCVPRQAELDSGAGVEALRRFNRALRAIPAGQWGEGHCRSSLSRVPVRRWWHVQRCELRQLPGDCSALVLLAGAGHLLWCRRQCVAVHAAVPAGPMHMLPHGWLHVPCQQRSLQSATTRGSRPR